MFAADVSPPENIQLEQAQLQQEQQEIAVPPYYPIQYSATPPQPSTTNQLAKYKMLNSDSLFITKSGLSIASFGLTIIGLGRKHLRNFYCSLRSVYF